MSRALERRREMFGDPLLIRSGRAYERTVRGGSLLRELQSLLPRLESMVRGQDFDPQRSRPRATKELRRTSEPRNESLLIELTGYLLSQCSNRRRTRYVGAGLQPAARESTKKPPHS